MTDAVSEVVQALEFPAVNVQEHVDPTPEAPVEEAPIPETGSGEYTTENPYQMILVNMFGKLGGVVHMGKSEIVAVIDEARASFEKL